MLTIDNKLLKDSETRSNDTTITEVFSALIVDKFILKNCELIVGDQPLYCLPDIYTKDKLIGFEITNCEAEIDFQHKDIMRKLISIDFDYSKFIQERDNGDSLFCNPNLKVTHYGNKITSSSMGGIVHNINWMYNNYVERLKSKLEKLNKGRYSGCKEVSLVVLSIERCLGVQNAEIMQSAYLSIIGNYETVFKNIFLLTTTYVFKINNKDIEIVYSYTDDEFSEIVMEMKKRLKIHQYAE